MEFKTYYRGLSSVERKAYACRAGTTIGYVENHLVFARKTPRKKLLLKLSEASLGKVSEQEIIRHFFGESEVGFAAE